MEPVTFFRYNDQTGEYKKLTVNFNGDGCFVSIEYGEKGNKEETQKLTIKLSREEASFLHLVLFKGIMNLLKK